MAKVEPLHNVHIIMEHFLYSGTKRAVGAGVMYLDENTVCCKRADDCEDIRKGQTRALRYQVLYDSRLDYRVLVQPVG